AGQPGTRGAAVRGEDARAAGTTGSAGAGGGGPVTTRTDVNFDVDWRFQRSDATGADAKAFADTSWSYVDLPHPPKFVTSDDTVAYAGIMWYRHHFSVPATYQGSKLFVEFGAAMQLADVWV